MTRIVRIDVEYCILLTPARSAAAYAHQVHRKAMIVGLKSSDIKTPFTPLPIPPPQGGRGRVGVLFLKDQDATMHFSIWA